MLSKPGEARKSASSASQRRRSGKAVVEKLDDVIRRLQRLPPNKACADCPSKLTTSVNLTHGTFVCMPCSGVHREFNHKIKGIGHSTFTAEEVGQLRHPSAGNEAVNSHYLARFSAHGRDSKLEPKDSSDLQVLRSWIQKKYIGKNWVADVEGGTAAAGRPSESSAGAAKPSKKNGQTSGGRRKVMPKAKKTEPHDPFGEAAEPPPPAAAAPAPVHDPFGFDSIVPAPASTAPATTNTASDTSWNAFGGSAQTSNDAFGGSSAPGAFQADFGQMNAPPPAPPPVAAPVPSPSAAAFPTDFGDFSQQPQQQLPQPTMVSLPPSGPPPPAQPTLQPPTQPQMQQPQIQGQQQPVFQANFNQDPMQVHQTPQQQLQQQQPQQPQQQQQQQQPPSQMQEGGAGRFANFPSMQQQSAPSPQQNQFLQQPPPQQQVGQNNQQQGQHVPQPHQHPQMGQPQHSQPPNNTQMQQQGAGSMNTQLQSQGGLNLGPQQAPPQPTPPTQSMQQQSNIPTGQPSGFANFSSAPPPQPQNQNQFTPEQPQMAQAPGQWAPNMHQPPQQQQHNSAHVVGTTAIQPLGGESANNTGATPPMPPTLSTSQPPPLQPPAQAPVSQQEAAGLMGESNNVGAVQSDNEVPAPSSDQPGQQPRDEKNESKVALNPNAFRSVDSNAQSAFDDAFGGLSLQPTPSASYNESAGANPVAPLNQKLDIPYTAPYREGQQLLYRNSQGSCMVTVKKVHFDDELNPYYTVDLDGREKQTDNAHLSLLPNSLDKDTSPLLQETVSMLQNLDPQQLVQVQQLIASIVSGNTSNSQATANSNKSTAPSPTVTLSPAMPPQPAQGLPSTGMGAPIAMQPPSYGRPQQATGMGTGEQFVSPPSMPSMQQQQPSHAKRMPQQSMVVGMDSQQGAPSSQAPAVAQQQLQPNQAMPQQQTMGMGAPVPTPPAVASTSEQFSMQQQTPYHGSQQQPTGAWAPSASSPMTIPSHPLGQAPVQPSMQQQQPNHDMPQHQPLSMGIDSLATAPPAAALPPVEKEGNPFDFY